MISARSAWSNSDSCNGPSATASAAAGFTVADLTDLREPVYYGREVDSALDTVLTMGMVKDLLAALDAERAAAALDHLHATLSAHHSRSGVLFDSCAWLITAHRA